MLHCYKERRYEFQIFLAMHYFILLSGHKYQSWQNFAASTKCMPLLAWHIQNNGIDFFMLHQRSKSCTYIIFEWLWYSHDLSLSLNDNNNTLRKVVCMLSTHKKHLWECLILRMTEVRDTAKQMHTITLHQLLSQKVNHIPTGQNLVRPVFGLSMIGHYWR